MLSHCTPTYVRRLRHIFYIHTLLVVFVFEKTPTFNEYGQYYGSRWMGIANPYAPFKP